MDRKTKQNERRIEANMTGCNDSDNNNSMGHSSFLTADDLRFERVEED